jgi:hypothetical protein
VDLGRVLRRRDTSETVRAAVLHQWCNMRADRRRAIGVLPRGFRPEAAGEVLNGAARPVPDKVRNTMPNGVAEWGANEVPNDAPVTTPAAPLAP